MLPLELVADPVRLRLLRHLSERDSCSLAEAAEAAGVHVNTARPHVTALVEAGALVRETAATAGPGRPAVRYRLPEGWTAPTVDFRGLAELLAAALVRSRQAPEELRDLGLGWGRYLLGRPGMHEVGRELPLALERLGFQAEVTDGELRLSGCPCPLVSPDQPELVCELAAAVADGVLAGAGSQARLTARRHDPRRRSCKAALRSAGRRTDKPRAGSRTAGRGRSSAA